jgi:16S rRNA (guanine527-N7)-methyltransferase
MDWDDLPGIFPAFADPEGWLPRLRRHAGLLEEAAPRVRVSSVAPEAVVKRQYAESLEVLRISLEYVQPKRIVDVGSGGGFPGIVFAVLLPEAEVHLIEPLQKRATLLAKWAEELGLKNVTVHPVRAEEAGRGSLRDSADLVTARAVAELRELVEYTAPLAAEAGMIALPKGSGAPEEIKQAAGAFRELGCEYVGFAAMRASISETLGVVVLKKAGVTPERFPRRPGVPGKRPILG